VKTVDSRARRWLLAASAAAFLVCTAVAAIPMAEQGGWEGASWFRLVFRPACHQMVDRCLDLGAGPLPICARCAGLYAGGLLGLLMTTLSKRRVRPKIKWLVLAAAPSVADFILGLAHLPTLANWPRFAAAVVPGVLAGLLLADAVCAIASSEKTEPTEGPIT